MKRMFLVSDELTVRCLRLPAVDARLRCPQRIASSACCAASLETSRVMERFSALRAILSISSM